jgi:predicted Zn-dependent peptidase
LTDEEIEFSRAHHLKALPFGIETPALEVAQKIRAHIEGRPAEDMATRVKRLEGITADEVRSAVSRHLNPGQTKIAIVCSADDGMLEELGRINGGAALAVKSYTDPL